MKRFFRQLITDPVAVLAFIFMTGIVINLILVAIAIVIAFVFR